MDNLIIINKIDRLDHLHSLVRQDLKDLGIKLPKLKRLKKLNQTRINSQALDGAFSNRKFGEPLYQVPGAFIPDYGYVPQFLIDAAKVVDKHIDTEGIFRKSGSLARQKELQLVIEEGQSIEGANIYDVTALVKQFFRELPEPIFVTVYYESFIKCYNLSSDRDPKKALLDLCLLLPIENIGVLRFTLHMLHRVASNSETNKMTSNNLAVVMAPNMMHLNKGTEKMCAGEEKLLHVQACIIELLIKNWELVGMVSATLRQQLSVMSDCFGTDDDLDASDDNTLEDSKDVLRRKKRKRSGSLTGFVSTIANGFAKLRRSTDGKSISMSTSSSSKEELSLVSTSSVNQTQELGAVSATPCVIKKRQNCVESVPFSASKKKAILNNLPQRSALASTPFTPVSALKKGQDSYHYSAAQAVGLNSTTPAVASKTSRKKLNLFTSPGSNKKVKRQSSAHAKGDSPPPLEKSDKGKSFFRRLSGTRGGKRTSQDVSACSTGTNQNEDSVYPLPPSLHTDSAVLDRKNSITRSLSSPSVLDSEISIVVVDDLVEFEDEAGSLVDVMKRQTCEPATDGINYRNEAASSDYHIPAVCDNGDADEMKVNTGSRSSRRDEFEKNGKRNKDGHSLKLGGHDELDTTNEAGRGSPVHLDVSLMDKILSPPHGFGDQTLVEDDVPGHASMSQQEEEDEEIDVGSDLESVSGFSTISGGTVMRRTVSGKYLRHGGHSTSGSSIVSVMSCDSLLHPSNKPKMLQSSVSTDSLLSVESRLSDHSTVSMPRLSRCASSDSGKGSLLEDAADDFSCSMSGKLENTYTVKNGSKTATESDYVELRHNKNRIAKNGGRVISAPTTCQDEKRGGNYQSHSGLSSFPLESSSYHTRSEKELLNSTTGLHQEFNELPSIADGNRQRSISAEHLGYQAAPRASMRARSHSIHISPGKKFNYKPHLEITRETHNLLARAGYFKPTDDNSNSKYVQVEVKSPKRSSYREEMMLTLRSSFRERHSQVNTSSRSLSWTLNASQDFTAFQDRYNSGNMSGCDKSLTHHESKDKNVLKDNSHSAHVSENLSEQSHVIHKLPKITANIEKLNGKDLSLPQVKNCDAVLTANESNKTSNTDTVENQFPLSSVESSMEQGDNEVKKLTKNHRILKSLKDTDKLLTLSGILDKEIASQVRIKRAEVMMPRHESIMNIQQAGLVTNSVRQFTDSQADCQSHMFTMPAVSLRGKSPIRIPTVFAQYADKRNHLKHITDQHVRERTGFIHSCISGNQFVDGRSQDTLSHIVPGTSGGVPDVHENYATAEVNDTRQQENGHLSSALRSANVEQSDSLMEIITDVCTPRSMKHPNKICDNKQQARSPLLESTNTDYLSQAVAESVRLRTPGGLTPSRILLHKDPGCKNRRNTPIRNNWHVKRLQNYNSPRRRGIKSPTYKTSSLGGDATSAGDALQVLTSVNIQIDE